MKVSHRRTKPRRVCPCSKRLKVKAGIKGKKRGGNAWTLGGSLGIGGGKVYGSCLSDWEEEIGGRG